MVLFKSLCQWHQHHLEGMNHQWHHHPDTKRYPVFGTWFPKHRPVRRHRQGQSSDTNIIYRVGRTADTTQIPSTSTMRFVHGNATQLRGVATITQDSQDATHSRQLAITRKLRTYFEEKGTSGTEGDTTTNTTNIAGSIWFWVSFNSLFVIDTTQTIRQVSRPMEEFECQAGEKRLRSSMPNAVERLLSVISDFPVNLNQWETKGQQEGPGHIVGQGQTTYDLQCG